MELARDNNENVQKTRSRSRSRRRCNDKTSSARSGVKKRAKATDALPPDVPPQCSHLPPPPYRPAGPFALYFATNLGSVDAKERERAMEMLAVKWGCMSDEEKVPYYQKAAEVKDAHRTKKAEFLTKREELGVKFPISGYAMFIADFASKNRGNYPCATDMICEGARAWKKLPLQEKDAWNKPSLESSESYAEKMWTVCKKKVRHRYGKYDARINSIKPVNFKPPGHRDTAGC